MDEQLLEDLHRFLNCFQLVFQEDWEYTKASLRDNFVDCVISPEGDFLEPKVSDEGNNWWNRKALLDSYRQLLHSLANNRSKTN